MEKRIENIKQKLKEQVSLAKQQNKLGGFSNAMYGFVEIIENDPIISKFIKIKIDQEYKMRDRIWKDYKERKIDNQTQLRAHSIYTTNNFWHEYYSLFKLHHDVIKIDKCKLAGINADNISTSQLFWYSTDNRDYTKIMDKSEINKYIKDFETCYYLIISMINTDENLLEKLNTEYKKNNNNLKSQESNINIDSFNSFIKNLNNENIKNNHFIKNSFKNSYFKCPIQPKKWEDITIRFKDEFLVNIKIKNEQVKSNYLKMGFHDDRVESEKRAKAKACWSMLHMFASKNGVFPLDHMKKSDKLKYQKRIQEISKILKNYFNLKDSPIEYNDIINQYTIKINLVSAYPENQWRDKNIHDEDPMHKEYLN